MNRHLLIKCPVCNSSQLYSFLSRKQVPVHQNILFQDQKAAINCERGDLCLTVCKVCGFVFNSAFEPAKLRYTGDYDNNQSYSPYFLKYIDDLIWHLVNGRGLRSKTIVEAGCGKGYFLRKLVEIEETNNVGFGFDPTYVGLDSDLNGRLRFERQFYERRNTNISIDALICRHVIEHVSKPVHFLRTIRPLPRNRCAAQIFIETPCIEWILNHQVWWDFFYEHCSYFSADSLKTAMRLAGFVVEKVDRVFGDQYLWLEATTEIANFEGEPPYADKIVQLCQRFGLQEGELVERWRTKLAELRQAGPIALWGAGAKGVTLANLVDPHMKLIFCVVDLNPRKQGGYVPGTGHPIISHTDLRSFNVRYAVQMNPNYAEENRALLNEAQEDVVLIDPTNWREMK